MFYLIHLDFRPGGASAAELREIWRRGAAAMRGSSGPGAVRGFKVVGQQTVFALAEFPDNGAVADALGRLANVEGLGDAAEVEFMPVRPYDEEPAAPAASLSTEVPAEKPVEEPVRHGAPERGPEEPAAEGPAEEPARPDAPERLPEEPAAGGSSVGGGAALEGPMPPEADEAPVERRAAEDGYPEEPVSPEPESPTPPSPAKESSITGAIRSLDKGPAKQPEGQSPDVAGAVPPEAERQPEGSVTGVLQSLDALGRAPEAPPEDPGAAGQDAPREGLAKEPAPPEDPSVTGVLQSLDAPGRAAEYRSEQPAADLASAGRGEPREEATPPNRADAPEDPSVTGVLRSLDAPGRAPEAPQGGGAAGQDAPREEAVPPAPAQDPSITGLIHGLDSPGREPTAPPSATRPGAGDEPGERAPAEAEEPARPREGSITGMIRSLDAGGPAQPETGREAGASADAETVVGPERPPEGSITGLIRTLDTPEHASAGPEAAGEAPGAAGSAKASEPRLLLRFVDGPNEMALEVGPGGATIGRSPDNSIRIEDTLLSRRHAQIELKNGGFWLTDLGSSNGTFVNGERLTAPRELRTGDEITFGNTHLSVALEGVG